MRDANTRSQWVPQGDATSVTLRTWSTVFLSAALLIGGASAASAGGVADVPQKIGVDGVYAFAVDPQTPTTVYAGTGCADLLKSTDGGDSWFAAAEGLSSMDYSGGVSALAIDPSAPNTLYAGRFNGGVFKSTNGGMAWQPTGLTVDTVSALAIDPSRPNTLYAGAANGNNQNGPFRSTDGGATWSAVASFAGYVPIQDLLIDPATTTTLYAVTGGVLKSTNGGIDWQSVSEFFSGDTVHTLALDPGTPSILYAGTLRRVFKTTNAGSAWRESSVGLIDVDWVGAIAVDPHLPSTLYVATNRGVFKSVDGAALWNPASTGLPPEPGFRTVLVIDPTRPATLYANTESSGLFKSTDGGAIWKATGMVGVVCGDGSLAPCNEGCDDGNLVNGDGCDANCTPTGCGNSVLSAGEQCDDGNLVGGDGCSASCRSEFCGDAIVQAGIGEQCDDGNTLSGDGCDANCTFTCGNGIVTGDEQCDDGNRVDGDGCDADCTLSCGNGHITGAEQCDDGNRVDEDGCSANCRLEFCGDGIVQAGIGEQCDDGNLYPFDGCTTHCTVCGDGQVSSPEECDDGNTNPADGCTNACTRCGDGRVTYPEECDDGNSSNGGACNADCTAPTPSCGNGRLDAGEDCDDGGICIGSSNAGTFCTVPQHCDGGQCKTFGGDGCAANCTDETDVVFNLSPGASRVEIDSVSRTYVPPLSGREVLTIGKQRNGIIPVVVKANSVRLSSFVVQVPYADLPGCYITVNMRAIAAKTCGGTVVEPDGMTPSPDCTPDDSSGAGVCVGKKPCTFVHGPGNSSSGVIGCNGLDNVNFSVTRDAGGSSGVEHDPVVGFNGTGGPGSALLLSSIGLDTVSCCFGRDFQYHCSPSLLVQTNAFVTGTAAAEVANLPFADLKFLSGSAAGAPFNCSALANQPAHATGAILASADVGRLGVGPSVMTTLLVDGGDCAGDCDGSHVVTVDEIVTMVQIALGDTDFTACPQGDRSLDNSVTVDEILATVNAALGQCPAPR